MRISTDRVSVLAADVALSGKARAAAGLADGTFDFVIMNPPFNAGRRPRHARPAEARRACDADGLFERWIRSAAAVVRPRGGLAVIARPQSLGADPGCAAGRFGKRRDRCRSTRAPRQPAIRIVVRAVRGVAGGLSLLPPLIAARAVRRRLHGAGRRYQQRPGFAVRRLTPFRPARRRGIALAGEILHPLQASLPETPP